MKNLAMILFAFVLLLATLGADGKRMTLENNERKLLSDQASTLGRKPDVGAKDAKDPAVNNKGAATAGTAENNGVVGLVDALREDGLPDTLSTHRQYKTANNPYVPSKSKE
ncbi:PREDICTED: uncharacterized protein LOC18603677 [Theobroma cacao]|uniref:Uncharacterized protein LOC18603677 n=1 Tax=Theobroma cacao TaxID=3641 RepID=A0AB32W6F9_THECC|nr:PREDICTED: uncharacterized protein LOC18603677 [Theobroma cacao]